MIVANEKEESEKVSSGTSVLFVLDICTSSLTQTLYFVDFEDICRYRSFILINDFGKFC